ncbi:hypothetical protein C1H46_013789 [Malus baccata]|uniref:R13L1/DRL21-like LRR repeat region domain-containing protein n=1 Tax=Malus baccata TaxID=106549 RepID=A0A540MP51_MALBA|nr:hypothetical protein C1H46_013789 [Malus baccata]
MPAGMCNLKNLQTLSHFVVEKQMAQRIGELKELQHLCRDLTISGVGNIDHEGNALDADIMSNKEYLDKLVLIWGRDRHAHEKLLEVYILRDGRGDDDHDPENDREVLNKLQPHTNLKQLVIISYGGVSFPGWLGDPYFSKLSCIKLVDCQHCCLLPPLWQLPSLKELHVLGMNNVVEIGSEFYGNDTCGITPFRSLQKLFLKGMLEWEKWSYYDGSRGNTTIMFPNLRELGLKNCPKLTEILPLEKLQSLEWVELCGLESFSGSLSHVESECPQFLSLAHLKMDKCPNFVCFPDGGMDAPKLKDLYISGCKKLRSLPEQMHTLLPSLQHLSVIGCPEAVPNGITFPNIRQLELISCPKLTEILTLEQLQSLERIELRGLESFSGLLSHVESECPKFLSLTYLNISESPNFVCFPDGEMDAPKLEELFINGCKKLRSLPEQMHTLLPSLQRLKVFGCPEVESFPQGGLPSNLQHLSFECCRKLAANRSLWGLTRLNSLRYLNIFFTEEGGEEMRCSFPEEGLLPATLTNLSIHFHPNLTTIQGKVLRQLTSLEVFMIHKCPELHGFPEEAPKSLKSLSIWECPNIGCLPGEWLPTSLSRLHIRGCPLLKERFRRETGEDWPKISHIPEIYI